MPLEDWKFYCFAVAPQDEKTGAVDYAKQHMSTCWAPSDDAAESAVRQMYGRMWPKTTLTWLSMSMADLVATSPIPGQTVEVLTPMRGDDGLITKTVKQQFHTARGAAPRSVT